MSTNRLDQSSIHRISQLIWQGAKSPKSLYLRGSVTKENKSFEPWDVDILLAVEALGLERPLEIETLVRSRCNGIPRLDLCIVPIHDFLLQPEYLHRRLLLLAEGQLVRGTDIRSSLRIPSSREDVTANLSYHFLKFWEERQLMICDQMPSRFPHDVLIRSTAKAVLRSVAFKYIGNDYILIREPRACFDLIVHGSGGCEEEAAILYAVVQGRQATQKVFIHACTKVIRHLKLEDSALHFSNSYD